MDVVDQPNSICHVQPIQMYPVPVGHCSEQILPFKLLDGEGVSHQGTCVDGLVVLTNYRLYLQIGDYHHHVPLGHVEVVEHRELFYLHIGCKDARTYRCTFANNESCLEWFDRLTKASEAPRQLEQIFAFYHFIWSKYRSDDDLKVMEKVRTSDSYIFDKSLFKKEMERLGFKGGPWRISSANENYKLCPTYPPYLIVPSCISDDMLESVAKFRSSRRVPAVVWRHTRNGAVIARCSQPEVGWLGWRSSDDEDLIKAISEACNFEDATNDRDTVYSHSPGSLHSEDSLQIANINSAKYKKVLIMDARSYTTAVANRARGGGCECPEYYPNCEIQFMNLANIHSIRKSFHALRLLCTSSADQPTWYSQLENTRWLQHMSGVMKAAVTLVNAVEREGRPALVHCSDGWDRTPQIVALAQLLLDPFYRTIEGFRILVEREWLAYGHKFADRCGQSTGSDDPNERCPVFLQWLDCVHQLVNQFSCDFEFSSSYLVKLVQHIYSNLYGTFLCNTYQERLRLVNGKTFSVWSFLNSPRFRNHLYAPPGNSCGHKVLWPQCNIRDLRLWSEVYLGSWEANFNADGGSGSCPGPPESSSSPQHNMTKTRSYGDLLNAADVSGHTHVRRSSDPSINNIDKKLTVLTCEDSSSSTSAPPQQQQQQQVCQLLDSCSGVVVAGRHGNDDYDGDTSSTTSSSVSRSCHGDDDNTFDIDDVTVGGGVAVFKTDLTKSDDAVIRTSDVAAPAAVTLATTVATDDNNCESDENECTETSEGRCSERTLCSCSGDVNVTAAATSSVETSTDTLVLSNSNLSPSPAEANGFETLQSLMNGSGGGGVGCNVCAQNLKAFNENRNHPSAFHAPQTKDKTYNNTPSSPMYSRTSSSSGWEHSLNGPQQRQCHTHLTNLGDDGLVPVKLMAQERLLQLIDEFKRKEELLKKELNTYRQAWVKRCCHKCTNGDADKTIDETSDSETPSSGRDSQCSPVNRSSTVVHTGSVVESVCSAGETQVSAVESSRSDLSWENLDESAILADCTTLWVPDHAVSRCTGCQTEFWVGKRKHHCRKCGRIFCASCSENSTPLPSEQLYNPVRVCTGCYTTLRRNVATGCNKSASAMAANGDSQATNQQIAASSN